jgi:hypothetical protein
MYELEETDYYVNLNRVMEMFLKGQTNATKISKALGLPRKDVLDYIAAWQDIARNNQNIKDRATEALTAMDKHYDMIIAGFWEIIENPLVDLKTKAGALKNVADVEVKRQETLQKAGLYDDAGIADELVRMEEYTEGIKNALFAVIKQYPETKVFIMEQFSKAGEPVVVEEPIKGEITKD